MGARNDGQRPAEGGQRGMRRGATASELNLSAGIRRSCRDGHAGHRPLPMRARPTSEVAGQRRSQHRTRSTARQSPALRLATAARYRPSTLGIAGDQSQAGDVLGVRAQQAKGRNAAERETGNVERHRAWLGQQTAGGRPIQRAHPHLGPQAPHDGREQLASAQGAGQQPKRLRDIRHGSPRGSASTPPRRRSAPIRAAPGPRASRHG